MKRLALLIPVLAALVGLSACGEKPQTMGGNKGPSPVGASSSTGCQRDSSF